MPVDTEHRSGALPPSRPDSQPPAGQRAWTGARLTSSLPLAHPGHATDHIDAADPRADGLDTSPIPRRNCGPHDGESLLLNGHAADLVLRLDDWCAMTGMGPADLAVSPLTSIPLPYLGVANAKSNEADAGRRWTGIRPESLWHPLFWLPTSLAHLDPVRDGRNGGADLAAGETEGDAPVEAIEAWMVRVCIALEASGLYDPQGGWIDVLTAAGLDTDDPATISRLQAWLDGQSDDILDGIDLFGFFDDTATRGTDAPTFVAPDRGGHVDDWLDEAVCTALPVLRHAAIVVTADDLGSACEQLIDPSADPIDSAAGRLALETLLLLASEQLPDVAYLASDAGGGVTEADLERIGADAQVLRDWPTWNDLLAGLSAAWSAWTVASRAQAGCMYLRRWFWPAVQQVQELARG